jgi:hypothetical protein
MSAPLLSAALMMTTPRDNPLIASLNIPFTAADLEEVA